MNVARIVLFDVAAATSEAEGMNTPSTSFIAFTLPIASFACIKRVRAAYGEVPYKFDARKSRVDWRGVPEPPAWSSSLCTRGRGSRWHRTHLMRQGRPAQHRARDEAAPGSRSRAQGPRLHSHSRSHCHTSRTRLAAARRASRAGLRLCANRDGRNSSAIDVCGAANNGESQVGSAPTQQAEAHSSTKASLTNRLQLSKVNKVRRGEPFKR